MAHDWIRKTGWPTHERDMAIATDIYEKWIQATRAEWVATQSRDYELLTTMICDAFIDLHDEEAIDSLQILLTLVLTMRGRREGKLVRRRIH